MLARAGEIQPSAVGRGDGGAGFAFAVAKTDLDGFVNAGRARERCDTLVFQLAHATVLELGAGSRCVIVPHVVASVADVLVSRIELERDVEVVERIEPTPGGRLGARKRRENGGVSRNTLLQSDQLFDRFSLPSSAHEKIGFQQLETKLPRSFGYRARVFERSLGGVEVVFLEPGGNVIGVEMSVRGVVRDELGKQGESFGRAIESMQKLRAGLTALRS